MTRAPQTETVLVRGDARRIPLADGSVHCVVTSPPYWSLRKYEGVEPGVWGGEAMCEHEWGGECEVVFEQGAKRKPAYHDGRANDRPDSTDQKHHPTAQRAEHAFCARCGAWRGCLGLEPTPDLFVAHLVECFREVRRVLRDDGCAFVNMGDGYTSCFFSHDSIRSVPQPMGNWCREGQRLLRAERTRRGAADSLGKLKPKDLLLMPARVALALQADGWWLRSDIIWAKPNPMPESCTDRPTSAHEHIFLLAKAARYFYDAEAVRQAPTESTRKRVALAERRTEVAAKNKAPVTKVKRCQSARVSRDTYENPTDHLVVAPPAGGRNLRNVWTIPTQAYPESHFATFAEAIPKRCIKAGTSEKGCCPACGAPWERVIESDRRATRPGRDNARDETGMANRDYERHVTTTRTTGWRPTCECDLGKEDRPTRPCVVLDPFRGLRHDPPRRRQTRTPGRRRRTVRRLLPHGPRPHRQGAPSRHVLPGGRRR